jgi:hypothetical protein
MTIGGADDWFAAGQFADKRCLGFVLIGIKLNRDIFGQNIGKIDRHREMPHSIVSRQVGLSDMQSQPMLPQAKLPTPHGSRRIAIVKFRKGLMLKDRIEGFGVVRVRSLNESLSPPASPPSIAQPTSGI